MEIDQKRVEELLRRLAEGLNVEVKTWINPDDIDGISKIVRGCFALRNRNGGYFVIGFDDKTLQPDHTNRPADLHRTFHIDKVQGLISRYAWELFEIGVAFPEFDGSEYPVICVPAGVRSPVAVKSDLSDATGKPLLRVGDVYFRSLSSNGTPSTTRAKPQDWREIVQTCFDNREGDIGAFLRRHLSERNIGTLASVLEMLGSPTGAAEGKSAVTKVGVPTLRDRSVEFMADGEQRFRKAFSERAPTPEEKATLASGSWEVSLVIDPPRTDLLPDQTFYSKIASSNPELTGWPVWLDSRGFRDPTARPKVTDAGWEALIASLDGWSKHVDFYRFVPKGEFYLWRNLPDDVSDKVEPKTFLEPIIVILRVAEAIAVGISISKALLPPEELDRAQLGFTFKWKMLKGRKLHPWANPVIPLSAFDPAHDDQVTTYVEAPASTPLSSITPLVDQATQELFVLFGGYRFPLQSTDNWVQKLLQRKL